MTKNTWMSAPAGVLGQGAADVRPLGVLAVGAAARPDSVVPGTGLPSARPRSVGIDLVPAGTAPTGRPATGSPCTPRDGFTAQFYGTTLGSHPSSRPLS